jgi:iron complex outermembrane receptor protein
MRSGALLLAGCLGLASTGAAQDNGTLIGRVLEEGSRAPIPSAAIRVTGTVLLAFSDRLGNFEVRAVPAGRQRISIERIGYAPREVSVVITPGGRDNLEVLLTPRPVAIGGVVAAVTKRELSLRDAPVSVSVLEERDIRRRVPEDVAEAVEYAPSVQFVGEQLNVRGSSGYSRGTGTRVMLLIDGIPANSGDSGALNWDMIPLTEVERIEVVKGAGSALYGTSALGGVVNVVTRAPPDEPTTRFRLRAGFYDDPPYRQWMWASRTLGFGSVEAAHGRRVGALRLWVRGGRSLDDSFRENDDSKRSNVALSLAAGDDADTLSLFGTWARERHGAAILWCARGECEDANSLAFQPLRVPTLALDDRTRSDKARLHLTHRRSWGPRLSSFERFSFQRNDWETDFGDRLFGAVADRYGAELRAGWRTASWAFLIAGVEGAYTDVDATLFGRHDLTDVAGFLQAELGVTGWLSLTAGARSDLRLVDGGSFSDPASSQLSPRAGMVIAPDPGTRVRASLGRGFRAPTVAELFTATEVGGFQVIPNPDLDSERSWAGEVGVQRLILPWLSLDIAGFFFDFEELIEADTVIAPSGAIEVRFGNLPEASIQGIEASGRISLFGDRLHGQLGWTYLDSESRDPASGATRPLPYRPEHLLTATGGVRIGGLDLGADYRFASAFDRVQVFTDETFDPRVPMRVLDLRLAYRIGRQTFRFMVDNALNYAYTTIERNLEPIRHYSLAAELEF